MRSQGCKVQDVGFWIKTIQPTTFVANVYMMISLIDFNKP